MMKDQAFNLTHTSTQMASSSSGTGKQASFSSLRSRIWGHGGAVDLSASGLTDGMLRRLIPSLFGRGEAVSTLDLSHNELTRLPLELQVLTQLRELNLSTNRIASFPKALMDLPSLFCLNLGSNELEQIPSAIGYLNKLRELDLSDNGISEIPPVLGDLHMLRRLDLSWNQISVLPDHLSKLSCLQELNLAGNDVATPAWFTGGA